MSIFNNEDIKEKTIDKLINNMTFRITDLNTVKDNKVVQKIIKNKKIILNVNNLNYLDSNNYNDYFSVIKVIDDYKDKQIKETALLKLINFSNVKELNYFNNYNQTVNKNVNKITNINILYDYLQEVNNKTNINNLINRIIILDKRDKDPKYLRKLILNNSSLIIEYNDHDKEIISEIKTLSTKHKIDLELILKYDELYKNKDVIINLINKNTVNKNNVKVLLVKLNEKFADVAQGKKEFSLSKKELELIEILHNNKLIYKRKVKNKDKYNIGLN